MKKEKQCPWAVRQAEAAAGLGGRSSGAGLAVQRLLQEPVSSALLGAALLSGQPCLLWNSQTILDQALRNEQNRLQASCWMLLSKVLKTLTTNVEEQAGYTILFRLLIEPFALMNQSTAFYPVGGIHPSTTCE